WCLCTTRAVSCAALRAARGTRPVMVGSAAAGPRFISDDMLQLVPPDHVGQPPRTLAHRALLRRIVYLHQPESAAETFRPLVVVEQRPVQVADNRDALAERARHLPEVEEDERPAVLVACHRRAILGDQDRQAVARIGLEEVGEPLR